MGGATNWRLNEAELLETRALPTGSGCQSCTMAPALSLNLLTVPSTKGPRSREMNRNLEYLLMRDSRELMKVMAIKKKWCIYAPLSINGLINSLINQ